MLSFGLPRAENCLRCRLRQTLQQASRTGKHFQGGVFRHDLQRRHKSTEVELPVPEAPQQTYRVRRDIDESGDVEYKIVAPRGKMRRIRGSTQREDRKQLGIKSLGQESEVIVLRDVPDQPKLKHQAEKVISFQATADSAHSMTAEEIEALFKKQKPAKRDEIEKAISDLRPQEEVLSRQEFDQGLKALTKGFSKSQLKNYLNRHTPKVSLHAQPQTKDVKTVRTGDVKYLERSEWSGGVTEINKNLAGVARPSSTSTDPSSPKQNLAASIYRIAWNVRVEEEATTEGELDLSLTPEQWGLLHTREATDLFSMMRSRKFYRNSRFERIRERGVIRVIGPKGETEDIANLFQSAFERASTHIVDLDPFRHGSSHTHSQNLSDIFTPTQLQAIMSLTKTYVVFDADTNKLSIHGFSQDQIDGALRLLIALLRLPVPRVVKDFVGDYIDFVGDYMDIGLAPIYVAKTLPSLIRATRLGRWTASVVHRSSSRYEKPSRPDAILQEPVRQDLIKHMEQDPSRAGLPVPADVEGSYWRPQIVSPPWNATFGYVLHEMKPSEITNDQEARLKDQEAPSEGAPIKMTPPASSLTQRPDLEKKQAAMFSPQAPGLNKALSYFEFAHDRRRRNQSKTLPAQLIVRLIPSPLSAADAPKLNKLPPINVVLNIDTIVAPKGALTERPATKTNNQWSIPLDETTVVKVVSINAALMETHYYVALPDQNVDLRFSKHWSVPASQVEAFSDPAMRTFITTVVESIKAGGELKAPQTIDLKLPSWMIRDSESSAAPQLSKHSYFFAGFEHRGRHQFSPIKEMETVAPDLSDRYVLSVNAIEGGYSGGRQIEVAVMPSREGIAQNDSIRKEADKATQPQSADDTKAIINAAESMVRLLNDAQTGALPPASRSNKASLRVDHNLDDRVRRRYV